MRLGWGWREQECRQQPCLHLLPVALGLAADGLGEVPVERSQQALRALHAQGDADQHALRRS